MNVALIFAGGSGHRMKTTSCPKQFLSLYGKPIIIYTLEVFEKASAIDAIVISCIPGWVDQLWNMIKKYNIAKVKNVVLGGSTGQESIYNGLVAAEKFADKNAIVLIHDGVRPIVDPSLVSDCVEMTQIRGNAIVVSPVVETIVSVTENREIADVMRRENCYVAKAPQCFFLKDILSAHQQACLEKRNDFIDSASMMKHYGATLHYVECSPNNIKITTSIDYYIFKALIDAQETQEIFL